MKTAAAKAVLSHNAASGIPIQFRVNRQSPITTPPKNAIFLGVVSPVRPPPACFGKLERPLKVGIAQDIMARQPDLDVHAIRVALAAYCSKASYLAVIVEGAVRFDLDGNATGTVDAGQAGYARKQLAKKRRLEANR